MGAILVSHSTLRDWVIEKIKHDRDNGFVAGLSSAINTSPSQEDVGRLFGIAGFAKYKHVRYLVVQAIGKLFVSRMAGRDDVFGALEILNNFYRDRDIMDESLQQSIRSTLILIQQSTGTPVALTGL